MKNREKLKAGQLAPFVGCDCYFNNGKDVLKGELTFLMLHQLEMGVCKEIVPILWGLDDMTEAQKELLVRCRIWEEWRKWLGCLLIRWMCICGL